MYNKAVVCEVVLTAMPAAPSALPSNRTRPAKAPRSKKCVTRTVRATQLFQSLKATMDPYDGYAIDKLGQKDLSHDALANCR